MTDTQEKLKDVRRVFGEFQHNKKYSQISQSTTKSGADKSYDEKYGKDCVEQRDYDAMDNETFEVVKNARPAAAHMRKTQLKWKEAPPDFAIFDDAHECERIKIAMKVVYIMKEYKLFEEGITPEEAQIIKNYFTSTSKESPTTAIIALIDKSIGNALKVMRNHPERFENEINNDVNNFIKSSRRAKPVLLDAMIAYACIPDCWGGIYYDKTVTARLAESKSQTVDTQKTEAATKKEEEGKKGTEAKEQKDQKGEGEKNEGTTDKESRTGETVTKETEKEFKKEGGKEGEKGDKEEQHVCATNPKEAGNEAKDKEGEKAKEEEVIQKQKELRKEIEHEQKVQENKEEKQEKESTDKKDVRAKSKLEGKKSKEKSKEDQKDGRAKTKIEGKTPKNDAKPKKPTGGEKAEKPAKQEGGHGLLDLIWRLLGYPKRPAMEQHKMRNEK